MNWKTKSDGTIIILIILDQEIEKFILAGTAIYAKEKKKPTLSYFYSVLKDTIIGDTDNSVVSRDKLEEGEGRKNAGIKIDFTAW